MKSLRLTQQMRDAIRDSIMSKWDINNPEPLVEDSREGLKNKVANSIQHKLYAKYEGKIPDEFLNKYSYIKLQLPSGNVEYWEFGKIKDSTGKYYSIFKLVTKEDKVEYVLDKTDPIWKEYEEGLAVYKEQLEIKKEYDKNRQQYCSQVRQVLDGVNTTKQLLEQWPEVEPFLPSNLGNPSSIQLPSVSIEELNKQL